MLISPAFAADTAQPDPIMSFLPLIVLFALFYFLIIRPQQKRQKEREALLGQIKKGDKIITAGGIHGEVIAVEEKTMLIEIADKVKVKIERNSISVVNKQGEVESLTK